MFVKLQILPEKDHQAKTKLVKELEQPQWDDEFTFKNIHHNRLQVVYLSSDMIIMMCSRF